MNIDLLNKELESILSSLEFEENGGLSITGFERYEDDWTLEFVVRTGVEDERQLWQCQIYNGLDFLLVPGYFDNLEIVKDHPLLWPHDQKQTSLYFGKAADDSHEVLSSLYSLHVRITKGWIPFDKFLNPNVPLIDLCKVN